MGVAFDRVLEIPLEACCSEVGDTKVDQTVMDVNLSGRL